jgi:hypothetical protein
LMLCAAGTRVWPGVGCDRVVCTHQMLMLGIKQVVQGRTTLEELEGHGEGWLPGTVTTGSQVGNNGNQCSAASSLHSASKLHASPSAQQLQQTIMQNYRHASQCLTMSDQQCCITKSASAVMIYSPS